MPRRKKTIYTPPKYVFGIAEKPSAAKQLAYALSDGQTQSKKYGKMTYYVCPRKNELPIVIGPALGHLYGLESQKGGWTYPDYSCDWERKDKIKFSRGGIPKSVYRDYFAGLNKLVKNADRYVIMTDYDQEGEVIGGLLIQKLAGITKYKQNTARMIYSTLQKSELRKSYNNRKPTPLFNYFESGISRSLTDWLVGINFSRALTLAIPKTERPKGALSFGRVQGPVLNLVNEREEEITNHNPIPYWQIKARVKVEEYEKTIPAHSVPEKFDKKEQAEKVYAESKNNREGKVNTIKERKRKVPPPAPFNLGALQKEASKIFKFTPKKTLAVAEKLYLKALISYPRTDSEKYPPGLKHVDILSSIEKQNTFTKAAKKILANKWLKPKEGKKTDEAHPAIYPTGNFPGKLPIDEFKVYSVIVWRYLATFCPAALIKHVLVEFLFGGHPYVSEGEKVINAGWFDVYPYPPRIKKTLPPLKEGQDAYLARIQLLEKETKPPKRYTKIALLKQMEKLDLGTKATRADIIEQLFGKKYLTGYKIAITELGVKVLQMMKDKCPQVVVPEFTRELEDHLEEIKKGKRTTKEHRKEVEQLLTPILDEFPINRVSSKTSKKTADKKAEDKQILGKCLCGKGEIQVVINPRTKKRFASCSTYGTKNACGTTFPLPQRGKIVTTQVTCKHDGWPVIKVFNKKHSQPWILCLNPKCPSKS